jgi:hypothetical protein
MGVYDGDEIERGPKDVTPAATAATALHNRLAAANADGGTGEGFRPTVVEDGLNAGPQEDGTGDKTAGEAPQPLPAGIIAPTPPQQAGKQHPKRTKPGKLPRNPAEYTAHVQGWLSAYDAEQEIEERWRHEMKLRNAAQVTSEDKAEIRLLVDQRIAQLRQEGK